VDPARTFVVQIGLRHRRAVDLGPEHDALHVSSVYSNLAGVVFRADNSIHIYGRRLPTLATGVSPFMAYPGRMIVALDNPCFSVLQETPSAQLLPTVRKAKTRG